MTRIKNEATWKRSLLLACLCVLVVAVALGTNLRSTWAKGGNWKNITLIYTTDVKGKIEPCG